MVDEFVAAIRDNRVAEGALAALAACVRQQRVASFKASILFDLKLVVRQWVLESGN
jgi:hypothetical protein